MWLSMSTAAAPVSECSCRLAGLRGNDALDAGEPAAHHAAAARVGLQRFSVALAIISSFSAMSARNLVSPAMTSVATTTSPVFSDGSRPPATPKEITPRKVDESSVESRARKLLGSLELQMTIMPGPAAMRASCTNPVTIKTGRGSIEFFPNRLIHDGPSRPQSHIPTPTILLLVLLKFRYRANAQSGKNLE